MKIQFRSREVLVVAMAIIAAQASTVIFGIDSGWLRLLSVVVMAGIYIVAIDYLLQRQDASYTKLIEANESIQWDVWMNGVKVGSVADSEYAAKQLIAFRDGLNALSQLSNAGRAAMNVLGHVFISVTLTMFWGAFAIAAFAPESFQATVQEFQKADPEAILSSAQVLLKLGVTIALMTIGFMASFGHRFGFTNSYSADVARMFRIHFSVPADGEISFRPRLMNRKSGHNAAELVSGGAP